MRFFAPFSSVFLNQRNSRYVRLAQWFVQSSIFSQAPPYVYKSKDGEYSGYLPDLLDRMGYNITITEADKYGSLLSNGTWTGMISDLADGVSFTCCHVFFSLRQFSYRFTSVVKLSKMALNMLYVHQIM